MKNKQERTQVIKKLFDELRKGIEVKSVLDLTRLELYEQMEERAINENSDKTVSRIRKMVREKKRKIYRLKSVGKRYIVEDGEIISITNLKQ